MESTPVSGKDGTEGSSQDNLLHAAKPLDEEGTNIVVLENEDGTSSSSGDMVRAVRVVFSEVSPSFDRIPKPRKSLKIQDGDRMTNQHVPRRSVVIIRPGATSSQVNPQDEEIAEEEAVCKFCSVFPQGESTLKTVCKCKKAYLIHKNCVAQWIKKNGDNCNGCGEKVEYFPVTLLRRLSSTRRAESKETNKNSCFSRLRM